jgi:hypothetical protein
MFASHPHAIGILNESVELRSNPKRNKQVATIAHT